MYKLEVESFQSLVTLIMLQATGCHLKMTKKSYIAKILYGKSHITHTNIFSLYFWSFQIGLGMHYLRSRNYSVCQLSLSSTWHLFKGNRIFCCWSHYYYHMSHPILKILKKRKSFWWSTAKRRRARGWKRRMW